MVKQEQLTVDQEINKLVEKLTSDFQSRLIKIVDRHTKRALREQATQLKTASRSTKSKPTTEVVNNRRARKHSSPSPSDDSDSDSE